jgi:hypothetical protein
LFKQTKIFEVLQLKKEEGRKLWVSDECTVLDAVKKVSSCYTGSFKLIDATCSD